MEYKFLDSNNEPGTISKPYFLGVYDNQVGTSDIPGLQAQIENKSYLYRAKKDKKSYFVGKKEILIYHGM